MGGGKEAHQKHSSTPEYKAKAAVKQRKRRLDPVEKAKQAESTARSRVKRLAADPDYERRYKNAYNAKNPEKKREQSKASYAKGGAASRAAKRKASSRRRLRAAAEREDFVSPLDVPNHYEYCACCGEVEKLTLDHIDPLLLKGADKLSNIQVLCKQCNSSKGIGEVCGLHNKYLGSCYA